MYAQKLMDSHLSQQNVAKTENGRKLTKKIINKNR